jgi:hypothetical protein
MKHNFVFVGLSQTQCDDEFPIVLKYKCSNPDCTTTSYIKLPGLISSRLVNLTINKMETQANIICSCPEIQHVDETKDNP